MSENIFFSKDDFFHEDSYVDQNGQNIDKSSISKEYFEQMKVIEKIIGGPNTESSDFQSNEFLYNETINEKEETKGQEEMDSEEKIITKAERKIRQIEYSNYKEIKRNECLRGDRFETQNLSKHLQTQTINYLKILIMARKIDRSLMVPVQRFHSSNGSLADFFQLFKHQQLRIFCLQFYSRKEFISNILCSKKMNFKNKIMMIKYLQKMRSTTYSTFKKWKNN